MRIRGRITTLLGPIYRVKGRTFIQCLLKGDQVEWSELPTCESITCSPPPNITNGMHNGNNGEIFVYNSSVTYKCGDNFSLTGEASIHCTTKDNVNGVWNGSAPECKVIITTDKPTTVPPKGTEVTDTSSGSALNTAGNSTAPEGGGLGILIDIGIGTGIGIVVLGAVAAIIPLAVLKKNRMKVGAS
ncbi:complement decay-accelerating factor-like isoform X2 [Mauremys mutica]|uniref:complement decay-accelerating factor-like isoform X2 n=1 Tax=Mauremys mutica TaxID=74926 RepID=UPI001D163EDC|nr:complement decay-accelerating factor-like isoform X2 [Mauremys mutica]